MPNAANPNDPRRFHTSQAIPRTYMGFSPETGPGGYGQRLTAVPQVTVGFTFFAGITTPQTIGDLPAGFVLGGDFLNHRLLTTGTVQLKLLAVGGGVTYPELIILAAGALTNVTDRQALALGDLTPLAVARTLVATVSAGTAGEVARCSLNGYIIDNGWF
jgi:hypothetical protein